MKKKRTRWPNVKCKEPGHETAVPGYLVCNHVKDGGQPVDEVVPPTGDDPGQILCKDGKHDSAEDGELICAHCVKARGWITPQS